MRSACLLFSLISAIAVAILAQSDRHQIWERSFCPTQPTLFLFSCTDRPCAAALSFSIGAVGIGGKGELFRLEAVAKTCSSLKKCALDAWESGKGSGGARALASVGR